MRIVKRKTKQSLDKNPVIIRLQLAKGGKGDNNLCKSRFVIFPEAFSQFWEVVKKNVDEGKTMISDNVEAAVEHLTETQNQDTFTFKSLYDKFMNLF